MMSIQIQFCFIGESIEDCFLRMFNTVTNDQKDCVTCGEKGGKKWTSQEQISSFPRAFIIGLNRVYYDNDLDNPIQRINTNRVTVAQVMNIPQTDPCNPPIISSLCCNSTLRRGNYLLKSNILPVR